jgi:two-component system, chemotaxis family, sensor histidine kinase and response regulator PixL
MPLDPTIREQTYRYFVQEAPELLQALEQGLLDFQQHRSITQVHTLLRATHTLKGAATSVELETIATVAHSLEDIFKALCQPNRSIDAEVEALLFEGVECLRLPLVAELTGQTVNHAEILDRTAAVFAQLQEKLGDCFDQDAQLPTSEELGFDVTQSIFEVGVAQRLEQLATAIEQAHPEEIAGILRTQADVFLGLAESLNLPGFAAIAQATIAALTRHPEQVITISQQALHDFQQGQAAVLSGDRQQGGQPSPLLQELANSTLSADSLPSDAASESLLETIWGSATPDATGDSQPLAPEPLLPIAAADTDAFEPDFVPLPMTAAKTKKAMTLPSMVRVNVKHLDQLNYAIGELLTQQNRHRLQTEHLQAGTQTLRRRLNHHQQLLNQLRQATNHPPQPATKSSKRKRGTTVASAGSSDRQTQLIQALLDDMVQLTEATEAIELFLEQASQTQTKQQQFLTHTRNTLIDARMMPLGEIFDRFPQVLQQLETLHGKPVTLKRRGSDVLLDKAIAEKLFDPLLHLVRNAFDHGIEPIAVRQQSGKSAHGQIELSAYSQGRWLIVEVRDDGNGLNFDQIRDRAVAQQRCTPDQASRMTQSQLIDLLFEPGFSTATQVSDLSGRGIGLDVVRNQLQVLRGTVAVHSEPQRGTTFTLQIPLNLTIASLLVCEAGGRTHALLDDAIEQLLIPSASQLQPYHGGKALKWQQDTHEQLVPIVSLAGLFQPPPAAAPAVHGAEPLPLILLRGRHSFLGLEVDRLVGEQELVIRPIGDLIEPPDYVQGSSILPDGQLALVLDGAMLAQTLFDRQHQQPSWGAASLAASNSPLTLPTVPTAAAIGPTPPQMNSQPDRQETRILVVEDSITTRQTLVFVLEKAGYCVLQAQDGREALAQLQQHSTIRLVICDLEMPGMNGFEFLRQAQRVPAMTQIPVLILSSRSESSHRSLAAQLGAAAYITKPYIEHKLLAQVADLLQQSALNGVPQ